MPERIQRQRTKGWRMPPDAVYVGRPGMWGNHAAIAHGAVSAQHAVDIFCWWVEQHASAAWKGRVKAELKGKNLACWCALDQPCHADVLLKLANSSGDSK